MSHIVPSPLPTLDRYRVYAKKIKQMSLTRAMQYDLLSKLPSLGKVIDIGGGARATYLPLLKLDEYDAVNIDPAAKPTWVVQINEKFPPQDNTFDTAISMNTFEHVLNVQFLLKEILRVLKPGGKLIASTPFLHPIHAHPDDYFRPTPSWLFESMREQGYEDIKIQPLSWGPFSTGLIASGTPGPFKSIRYQLALLVDLLFLHGKKRSRQDAEYLLLKHALGFFVTARKPAPGKRLNEKDIH